MAENVHLYLKIEGSDIKGASTQLEDGGIECYSLSFGVSNPVDWQTGSSTGRCQYQAIAISKRIDKDSPLLLVALAKNQNIDAKFKFFRPKQGSDSESENFYTITIKYGRVESVSQSGSSEIPMETITFAYRGIDCVITDGNVTHTDDWKRG